MQEIATRYRNLFTLMLMSVVILVLPLSGCSAIGGQIRDDDREEEIVPEPAITEEESEGDDESERLECPQNDVEVLVDYIHILIARPPDGEVKMMAPTTAEFFVTFRGDGSIDSKGFENRVIVGISGTLEDCTIEGDAVLSADFTGTCRNGFVEIDIVEQLHAITTMMTCPGEDPQIVKMEGMFSAPEDHAQFELRGTEYTHILELDVVLQSLYYSWTFKFGSGIEPIFP